MLSILTVSTLTIQICSKQDNILCRHIFYYRILSYAQTIKHAKYNFVHAL